MEMAGKITASKKVGVVGRMMTNSYLCCVGIGCGSDKLGEKRHFPLRWLASFAIVAE